MWHCIVDRKREEGEGQTRNGKKPEERKKERRRRYKVLKRETRILGGDLRKKRHKWRICMKNNVVFFLAIFCKQITNSLFSSLRFPVAP